MRVTGDTSVHLSLPLMQGIRGCHGQISLLRSLEIEKQCRVNEKMSDITIFRHIGQRLQQTLLLLYLCVHLSHITCSMELL